MLGRPLEHGAQVADGRLGLVSLVVESGQEYLDFGIRIAALGQPLKRAHRLLNPTLVNARHAEAPEKPRIVRDRPQPNTEEQGRLMRPTTP
jgi:hypothetical protein